MRIFLSFLISILPCLAHAVPDCEAIYQHALKNTNLKTLTERARYLETADATCIKTGMFDVWLAAEYMDAGDNQKAIEIAQNALKRQKQARPNLLQVIAQAHLNQGKTEQAEKLARDIAAEFPNYVPNLGLLLQFASKKQDWKQAKIYVDKIHSIEPTALSYLGLATVYHQLDRHTETVDYVYKALAMEPQRIAKVTGILEAIFSLVLLDRRPEATELARRHMAANPNWRDNKTFARAAFELGLVK